MHTPTHTPTHEQTAATEAFPTGAHLVIQAGAGTGRTTTLALLARTARREGRRGRYIAFNRAVARHAARAFPPEVACGTAHALAYTSVGREYQSRMNAPRRAGWRTGAALGIDEEKSVRLGARKVTNRALSHTVLRTVTRFCQSADQAIAPHHVPPLRGAESEPLQAQLAELTLPCARKAWADLQHPDHGAVRFEHDHYLKMWALREPVIPADFLLLDEAQDTNPVVEQVCTAQRDHAQLVLVGDSAQAIYGWRGARDVMTGFDGRQLSLSRSFRFGPPLAAEANRWLTIIGAPIRLTGSPGRETVLGTARAPDAILCRTNAGAMVEVIRQLDAGRRVALAGGGEALSALARAAHDLESGRRTAHPELVLFETWGELREYAEFDPAGRDLLPLVELADEHGTEALLCALDRLSPEDAAEVTVSTAHRAKGREWARVRIADDFTGPDDLDERDEGGAPAPGPVDIDEARLACVAVTRARSLLDIGGLSWINTHPAGDPRPTTQRPRRKRSKVWKEPPGTGDWLIDREDPGGGRWVPMRTGNEPLQARSPLKIRCGLALWGMLWAIAGAVAFVNAGSPEWAAACAALAMVAATDLVMVIRHIRQGPHYQPGKDIPPYTPDRGRNDAFGIRNGTRRRRDTRP